MGGKKKSPPVNQMGASASSVTVKDLRWKSAPWYICIPGTPLIARFAGIDSDIINFRMNIGGGRKYDGVLSGAEGSFNRVPKNFYSESYAGKAQFTSVDAVKAAVAEESVYACLPFSDLRALRDHALMVQIQETWQEVQRGTGGEIHFYGGWFLRVGEPTDKFFVEVA